MTYEVYRILIRTERSTDWHPLNSKVYTDVGDARRAVTYHERNSAFFRWGDEFKIQVARLGDGHFEDLQSPYESDPFGEEE